ncbi:uncharacterized protein LOC127288785 isoform X2 [Leptopilina boulardi]|nr:uncharacterized protein LOC127288785 isoform X2 [Leptopilina boulardi]
MELSLSQDCCRTMNLFENHYYRINTFYQKCTGIWPYQRTEKKRLIKLMSFTLFMCNLIPMFLHVYTVWGDLDETLESLPTLCIILAAIFKSSICIYKESELKELLECIKNDWKVWSSGKEFEILQTYAESGRSLSLLYTGDVYVPLSTIISMSLSPIILDIIMPLEEPRPKLMIYPVEFFIIDQDKYFIYILALTMITAVITMTYTLACESMYAVNTQHACGLFAIVSYRYQHSVEEAEILMKDTEEKWDDVLYEYMKFSIKRHIHAIKFCNTLESCYSPLLFSGMAFNMLQTSITLLQTLLSLGNFEKTIKYAAFNLGVIAHMFLISLPAQRLMDHSSSLGQDL